MQTGIGHRVSGIGQLRKGSELADRLMDFAVGVLKVTAELPKAQAGRHIAAQLVRAATSAGANYEEARAADSTADFAHKARIAAKEARESAY
jgi:four helix bundle protein